MATALDIHVDQGSDVRVPIAFIDEEIGRAHV